MLLLVLPSGKESVTINRGLDGHKADFDRAKQMRISLIAPAMNRALEEKFTLS
jgi:hypothetical protein